MKNQVTWIGLDRRSNYLRFGWENSVPTPPDFGWTGALTLGGRWGKISSWRTSINQQTLGGVPKLVVLQAYDRNYLSIDHPTCRVQTPTPFLGSKHNPLCSFLGAPGPSPQVRWAQPFGKESVHSQNIGLYGITSIYPMKWPCR